MAGWFVVRRELSAPRVRLLTALAFLLPLGLWSLVSYVPGVWSPMVRIEEPADLNWLKAGQLMERGEFERLVERQRTAGASLPEGTPANPVYLPAPHEVGRALYTAFTTEPVLRGDKWLHESLWMSLRTIFWGFLLSAVVGVPLGLLCGAYAVWAKLTEPFVDFIRYMPAPAFGALMVAIFGIHLEPKVAVIFIGTFFQMVLVVANTVRKVDHGLIEAAQTLGAKPRHLVLRILLPASLPDLYNDLRILLGWAWTYLIVAEVVGVSSGITFFINQQAKYRNFDNVYAAIILIGIIGFASDQLLGWLGKRLFAWRDPAPSRFRTLMTRLFAGRDVLLFPDRPANGGGRP